MRKTTSVDSGWAWMIMLAAFLDLMLAGIMYCTGVFNVVFLEEFNKSKALTSWCGGLQASLLNLGGLLASVMADRLGTRVTILIGGAMVSFGFIACSFATSFVHIFICYGFIAGLGLGIVYTPAVVILGSYFKRYRNLAYGIITTGIGVGTMSFAPLIDYLVEQYTWKGAMLVMAGIFMNYFVVGALMRPPCIDIDEVNIVDDFQPESITLPDNDKSQLEKLKTQENPQIKITRGTNLASSLINIRRTKDFLRSTVSLNSNSKLKRSLKNLLNLPNNFLSTHSLHQQSDSISCMKDALSKADNQNGALPIKKENGNTALNYNNNNTDLKEDACKGDTYRERWYLNLGYLSYVFNLLFVGVGISCVYVHFPAYVIIRGTSLEQSSTLVSVMGFGSIVGRLSIGAITNKWQKILSASYVSSCLLTGIVCILGPVLSASFIGQAVFSFLFATLANCFIALMAPMCIHTVGLANLNLAYGIAIVICGIGYLIGPPIAGWLFDLTSSYVYTFLLSGFCYAFGGIIMVLTSILSTFLRNSQ